MEIVDRGGALGGLHRQGVGHWVDFIDKGWGTGWTS